MKIVPLAAGHLAVLHLQPAQYVLSPLLSDPSYAVMLAAAGPAFTALSNEIVIGSAGLVRLSAHRSHAWALLSAVTPGQFLGIHKVIARFVADQAPRRIETAVDCEFSAGHRWARMLGFEREGRMRAYGLDGRDADLYAKVRM